MTSVGPNAEIADASSCRVRLLGIGPRLRCPARGDRTSGDARPAPPRDPAHRLTTLAAQGAPVSPTTGPRRRPPTRAHRASLVLHGFTGNPSSMRAVADAFGPPTTTSSCRGCPATAPPSPSCARTAWRDWAAAADDAYRRLAARTDRIVVIGLSMGGSLSLSDRARPPRGARPRARQPGDAAISPTTCGRCSSRRSRRASRSCRATTATSPSPATRSSTTRARRCASCSRCSTTAWRRWPARYGELTMPLLLFTSHQDHVVDPSESVHLAADVRRPGRPPLARAQLPRRHPGLRPRRHHRRRPRLVAGRVPRDRLDPQPGEQRPPHRSALAQRLRADDRPRRARRGVAVRAALRAARRRPSARSPARSPSGP